MLKSIVLPSAEEKPMHKEQKEITFVSFRVLGAARSSCR